MYDSFLLVWLYTTWVDTITYALIWHVYYVFLYYLMTNLISNRFVKPYKIWRMYNKWWWFCSTTDKFSVSHKHMSVETYVNYITMREKETHGEGCKIMPICWMSPWMGLHDSTGESSSMHPGDNSCNLVAQHRKQGVYTMQKLPLKNTHTSQTHH